MLTPFEASLFVICLQLYVRKGDQVFRDEVIWDVSNPQNTADTYAIRVCADLGLSCDWYDAITANLKSRIDEVRQVRFTKSESIFLWVVPL